MHKITHTKDEETFIMTNLEQNPFMAGFCHVPLQCSFICSCLMDIYECAETREAPTVNTTTDLYVQATVQMASKLHPRLKYNKKATVSKHVFDSIDTSLQKHADLAAFGLLSSPPKLIFYSDDLCRFGFDSEDRKCGFLIESQTKGKRRKGANRQSWTFTHTTMQEFFAALGLLRSNEDVWGRVSKNTVVEQLKTMVCFLAGLLEDSSHSYFMERLVPNGAQIDSRNVITELTGTLKDDAVTIAAVYETQNAETVDLVGTEISSTNMSSTEVRALVWVLEKEECRITTLR